MGFQVKGLIRQYSSIMIEYPSDSITAALPQVGWTHQFPSVLACLGTPVRLEGVELRGRAGVGGQQQHCLEVGEEEEGGGRLHREVAVGVGEEVWAGDGGRNGERVNGYTPGQHFNTARK